MAALRANARETERGLVLTLSDVLFGSNQATLTPGAMHRLQTLVTVLKAHPERQVTIEGYTDSMGSGSYNLGLSQRRAEAVRNFLLQNGVEASRITARGYGEASPVAPNTTEAGRQVGMGGGGRGGLREPRLASPPPLPSPVSEGGSLPVAACRSMT